MVQRFFFDADKTKTLDARRIDDKAGVVFRHGKHLCKCGRVPALVVHIRNLGRLLVQPWNQGVEQGGLAHPTVATHQVNTALHKGPHLIQPNALFGGNGQALIARLAVHGHP